MDRLTELARTRLAQWFAGQPGLTQKALADVVGHEQGWVSNYFAGRQNATIDELDAMARRLGGSLTELFDAPKSNPAEARVLELYRALPASRRPAVATMLEAMQTTPPRRRRRTQTP